MVDSRPAGILPTQTPEQLISYINVKLALLGCQPVRVDGSAESSDLVSAFAAQYQEKDRLLGQYLCPADQRIQTFLYDYLQDVPVPRLPLRTFTLDRAGLTRVLSLPVDRDEFSSDIITSFRVKQGVLHNPRSDRRTTAGIFHVTEGGLPIPDDKLGVPKLTFAKMLGFALNPPRDLMRLPFTATQTQPAECFVSLLLRPIVCPEVPGFTSQKTMEVRFFVPGNMVSNLDFVESIFGNAGDPLLPENDSGLDTEHWTGHTGCVVLAPHLVRVTKKAAGLPEWKDATERQRRDGMCWKNENELYNNGGAFKLTCRDEHGVIVTIIADNYFGYCKKEVKTQISYAANLFGLCEEEHAGGALVFAAYDLGEEFAGGTHVRQLGHTFKEVADVYRDFMDVKPEGYGVDKKFSDILYVPEHARFDLHAQRVTWKNETGEHAIKLLPTQTYVRPSGYKVRMEKPPGLNRAWRLVGIAGEGLLCHKPCTVSGGGKSEISKPITDAILTGPVFVADLKGDMNKVALLINRDYSDRFKDKSRVDKRAALDSARSLGSVIKLLSPDERDFTPEYNAWLESVPQYIKELVFVVKRYYKPEWGANWSEHFSVDIINGTPGNELKCDNRKLVTTHLRVGFDDEGAWRTFGLRKDYYPASKIQMEDDITASVVVPGGCVAAGVSPAVEPGFQPGGNTSIIAARVERSGITTVAEANPGGRMPPSTAGETPAATIPNSLKFVTNCERRLFQRPDDAIHRGYDKLTEKDFVRTDNFFSNYEPLKVEDACSLVEEAIGFNQFTEPMQSLIRSVAEDNSPSYFVSSANPRIVDGKPSKNPRYLQVRPDLLAPREVHLAEMATRLRRHVPPGSPVHNPVGAVLPGRRNNPPEPGIRSLAVFNPIHYFELPELFMEFICSMTGKSPSTTGAGSEGALTKGPFNALPPIIDLNNALVSFLLTGHDAFVTAAGYVGPKFRVDHDVSLLVPEVWCHMNPPERDPQFLIANHYLDKCEDFVHDGKKILASRLGYRINIRFVHSFFGRVFNHPHAVFTDAMLKPEMQDMAVFVDGMENIIATQKRVSKMYFDDGSIAQACPPLQALLHIMLHDQWQGKDLNHADVRKLFTRENLLASDWYAARLKAKQSVDRTLWKRHVEYLDKFLKRASHADEAARLRIADRLTQARKNLAEVDGEDYWKTLNGTLGAEPIGSYR